MNSQESGVRGQESAARRLAAAALRWKGTPFQAHARIPGAGVDCVQLAAALLEETGLTPATDFPTYSVDFGDHADVSPLLQWLTAQPTWRSIAKTEVQPGDVAVFQVGKVPNHVGVALGEQRFCHCLRGHGVLISNLADPTYARRWVNTFRPCSTANLT